MIDRINFLLKYVLCVFSRRWHLFCHVYEVIFFFLFIFLSEAPHIICTALFFHIHFFLLHLQLSRCTAVCLIISCYIYSLLFFGVYYSSVIQKRQTNFILYEKKERKKMINTKDMKQICTWRMSHFNFSHPFRTLWNENAFFYVSYKNIQFESWVC